MASRLLAPNPRGDGVPFVRRLGKSETCNCVVYGADAEWVCTHWDPLERDTSICRAERAPDGRVIDRCDCTGCKAGNPERIKGYLYIYNQRADRFEFLEITPTAWESMRNFTHDLADFRGWRLTLVRGEGKKSRFKVSVFPPAPDFCVDRCPKVPELERSLAKLMR